jgi:hypothetical protein
MKHFSYVDHFLHDLGLSDITRNAVEHQRVNVWFKLVRLYGRVDCLSPELDRDIIRHELAFARVIQKRFTDLGARVDGAEYVAAGAVIKAWNRAKGFALRSFAAARRAKEDERVVSHGRNRFIAASSKLESRINGLFSNGQRIDIHPSARAIETHVPIHQRKNRVVAPESHVFSRYKFGATLAHYDVASDDHFAAEFFDAQPLADAVASILNATLSFFVSHFLKLRVGWC